MPVDYHAWTHRPKALGGTDPIEVEASNIPWVRLKQLDVHQEWTASDSAAVVYDDVVYSASPAGEDYFLVGNIGPDIATVQPLVSGLYQTTFRAYLDITPIPFPNDGFEISLVNLDMDQWDWYSTYVMGNAYNNSGGGYAEATFRAQANDFAGTWNPMQVQIRTFADAMQLQDNGGGTYWEIRYLGPSDTPLGLDNQNAEG